MATAARPAPEPADCPWRGDDFPGWLSPMLVKELRQGIQSGVFAWTFVGLQAVMFLVMATMLGSATRGLVDLGPEFSFFWPAVTLAVAIVVPLRGLGAISSERTGNNLDLVRLTHLSAFRIVTGKWLAIVAQSALLATAVLPYLVLRYFFGGVDVVRDLAAFGWVLAAAAFVAAAAVAASTRPVRERIGLVILMFFAGSTLLQAVTFMLAMGGLSGGFGPGFGLALMGLYTALCLEHAAAAIAPPAENHAAVKRGIGLALAATWPAVGLLGRRDWFLPVAAGTIVPLVAVAIEALCEQPSGLVALHAPFARRGPPGRLAARLLTPGWATGLVFVAVAGTACITGTIAWTARFAPSDVGRLARLAVLAFATLVYPLPVVVAFARTRWRFAVYATVQIACLFVLVLDAIVATSVGGFVGERPLATVVLFPPAALLRSLDAEPSDAFTLAVSAAVVTLVVFGLVAGPWLREMAVTRRLVQASTPANANPRTPEPAA